MEHIVGDGAARSIATYLVGKGTMTYRDRIDEYRVWHGTDIDVSARLSLCQAEVRRGRCCQVAVRCRQDGARDSITSRDTDRNHEDIPAGIRLGRVRTIHRTARYCTGMHNTEPYWNGKPVIAASIDSGRIASLRAWT